MRGSFSRDIIEGLLKPRGLLLLALTAAAAATAAWAAPTPHKIAAAAAIALAAVPAMVVWGGMVGLSRRIEAAAQARNDLGWAVDGLHGRGEELGATTRNLEAWCGQLAERAARLEGLVSELQASHPALSSRLDSTTSRGEELRLIVIDLAHVVQQIQNRFDPLAQSLGAANDTIGRILAQANAEAGAAATARNVEAWSGQLIERISQLEGRVSSLQEEHPAMASHFEQAASRAEALRLIVVDLALALQQLRNKVDPLARGGVAEEALAKILPVSSGEDGAPAPAGRPVPVPGQQLSMATGTPLLHLETTQAEHAQALQRIAGRLALVEDGLLAQAVTIENVVRGTTSSGHAPER